MKVCDCCNGKLDGNTVQVKILGETYDLCMDCAERVTNYIKYSRREKSGIAGFVDRLQRKK